MNRIPVDMNPIVFISNGITCIEYFSILLSSFGTEFCFEDELGIINDFVSATNNISYLYLAIEKLFFFML